MKVFLRACANHAFVRISRFHAFVCSKDADWELTAKHDRMRGSLCSTSVCVPGYAYIIYIYMYI